MAEILINKFFFILKQVSLFSYLFNMLNKMWIFPLNVKKSHLNLLFQKILEGNLKRQKFPFFIYVETILTPGFIYPTNPASVSNNKPLSPLRGGGKKHKKKVYTKPKKTKHISPKTKLRILSYFSVTKGKVQRLRRTSPEASGCFMAEHTNRVTCGKTGLTFIRSN